MRMYKKNREGEMDQVLTSLDCLGFEDNFVFNQCMNSLRFDVIL
ncbi:protein of unknown function [Candidatus Nitrosocosmicus franklandus]|uniref:Uncharacterized protein n=1 Tax=Candidatus Nitrosocosmicus franklandianus TaxID=1798806 RepID=A0A484I951_9ARCH|nr:protein of unknown function [Candidatus Nitrosocosmicus franklandus]